jgi:hypothetical protein
VWRGVLPLPRRIPRSATFPWGLVDAFRGYGLDAWWQAPVSERRLRAELAAGDVPLVVLGGWRPRWAHWVVVVAWDAARGWGLVDPAAREHSVVWRSADDFRRRWRAFGRQRVRVRAAPRAVLHADGSAAESVL